MYKKLISILIVSGLLFSMFIGCSNSDSTGETTKESTTTKQTTKTEESKTEESKNEEETKIVSITTRDPNTPTGNSYADNLPVWQIVEDKLNIEIVWDVVPKKQYNAYMETRLAAGAGNLNDIIRIPNVNNTMLYARSGLIIAIDGLIEEYAPNIKEYFDKNPELKSINSAPDGHMYKLSHDLSEVLSVNPFIWGVRKDWLDKVSLEVPETIDEWTMMAKAFKQDLNGNGEADEIPIGAVDGMKFLMRFGEAWGLQVFVYSAGFSVDDNNQVHYDYMNPRFKEFLTWLNKLYEEDLIDPEFTSISSPEMWGKVSRNLLGTYPGFLQSTTDATKYLNDNGVAEGEYVAFKPLKGPYGDQMMEVAHPFSAAYAITKDCDDPKTAIELLDFITYSKEGNDLMMFGIEGRTYQVEDGIKKFTNVVLNNNKGLGTQEVLWSYGSWPFLPHKVTPEVYEALYVDSPYLVEASKQLSQFVVSPFPRVIGTDEENTEYAGIMADMLTYTNEMIVKFIIGEEDLNDFDEFVSKIEQLKIADVLAIKQAQYDRYLENLK